MKKRFIFVSRIKFAKYYSSIFFQKEYIQLERSEKFYLTNYIFYKDIKRSYINFQNESGYKIFNKLTLDEFNKLENEQQNIDLKCEKIYKKIFF